MKLDRCFVKGPDRRAVGVELSVSRLGVARVDGNADSAELKIVVQYFVAIVGIKRSVGNKGFVRERRVCVEKIRQDGFERDRISDFLVKVRVVSLWSVDSGVLGSELLIEKSNVPDDTDTVSDDTGFVSVTKMPVDILVLHVRVSFSSFRQQGVD